MRCRCITIDAASIFRRYVRRSLFTGRSVNDLADAKERHHLKDELMETLEHEYHGDVMGVYFTEFVTQ